MNGEAFALFDHSFYFKKLFIRLVLIPRQALLFFFMYLRYAVTRGLLYYKQ